MAQVQTVRRGVYRHSRVARTFFLCTVCLRTSAHFSCVSHKQVHEKGVSRMSVFVLYVAFHFIMFHPSLMFLHTHFDITFLSTILPCFPVLKAQDMRNSAFASRSLAIWPSQMQKQKLCLVGSDRDTKLKSNAEIDKEEAYELPDGIIIIVGAERFHCVEVLFQPSFTDSETDSTTLLSRTS